MKTLLWQNGYGDGAFIGENLDDCIEQAKSVWPELTAEEIKRANRWANDGDTVWLVVSDEIAAVAEKGGWKFLELI